MEHIKALKEARERGDELDFWGNNQPKCPHCGDDYSIQDNDAWFLYKEGLHEDIECASCGRLFMVLVKIEYKFSTDQQDNALTQYARMSRVTASA